MGLGSLFKSLLGKHERAISDAPFGSKPLSAVDAEPVQRPPTAPAIVVGREEIIDSRSRLAGYRVSAYCALDAAIPAPADAVAALRGDNIASLRQRRLVLISLAVGDWDRADYAGLVAAQTYFLLSAAGQVEPDLLASSVAAIKAAGANVALPAALLARMPVLLTAADLAVIALHDYPLEKFERQLKQLVAARPQLPIVVAGVSSWTEHRLALGMGARYSLGGFAGNPPEVEAAETINQSRLVLIEMLNLLRRDAELDELADFAKRDPGVAVKLVDMANSPMSGLSAPVASLQQALLVMGRETLYRWLTLGIYRAGNDKDERDEALLELALCRARFLELVATGLRPKQECDELFLVGMVSLLDSLLGTPMPKVIAQMNLPPVVVDVLLHSEGAYGRFLALALALEKQRHQQAEKFASELGLTPTRVAECYHTAFAWAQQALESL